MGHDAVCLTEMKGNLIGSGCMVDLMSAHQVLSRHGDKHLVRIKTIVDLLVAN